jgi:hypothetical protein
MATRRAHLSERRGRTDPIHRSQKFGGSSGGESTQHDRAIANRLTGAGHR